MLDNKMKNKHLTAFISYSHKDEPFKDQLELHLSALKRMGSIATWHDREIVAGSEWENEIDSSLGSSDIVILLISADFIASEYCYGKELKKALQMHDGGLARVVPIIVRPCVWKNAPFAYLQALPKDGKPVTMWNDVDEAWLSVVVEIENTIRDIKMRKNLNGTSDLKSQKIKQGNVARKGRIKNIQLVYDKLLRPDGHQCKLFSALSPEQKEAVISRGHSSYWTQIGWAPNEKDVGTIIDITKHYRSGEDIYIIEFSHRTESVFVCVQSGGVNVIK